MILPLFLSGALLSSFAAGASTEYGLTGFPANSYDPVCAIACLRSFYMLTLNCSDEGQTVGMITFQTSTECYAQNTAYLTSVAWCADVRCAAAEPSASLMEYWWDMQITGQKNAGLRTVPAEWTYAEALAHVKSAPTVQLDAADTVLNVTSLVPPDVYESQYNVLFSTQREGRVTNGYGIAMLVTGFDLPVVLTALGYLPFISHILSKLPPWIVWPSTVSSYHVRSLPFLIGKPPLIGHALYIAILLILNIVLSCVNYQSRQPNAWNPRVSWEIMSYVLGRTGTFAYIQMPLVFLFAGRNNILLWMTNWSHSTFLILHRWTARIFTLQVLAHSIVSLAKYLQTGMYVMESAKPYWIWGIVATIAAVILCFGSGLYFRNYFYQAFLLVHIALSVILVVGCWYHAYDLYGLLGGYGYWIYATAAVWCFDRIGRIVRVCIVGRHRTQVTAIGGASGYARIDVKGIRWGNNPGMHAYLYFPTLTPWIPWENHPFSVMPSVSLRPSRYSGKAADREVPKAAVSSENSSDNDVEKSGTLVTTDRSRELHHSQMGLTFFVRRGAGTTKLLEARRDLLTLVEGPYQNNSSEQVLRCDRLLLLGGGIGITALVPFLASHWNVKLGWSVRADATCLVEELDGTLSHVADKKIVVAQRLDLNTLISEEAETGWEKLGIVVSGPPEMCDDARSITTTVAKQHPETEISLDIEAYAW